MPDSLHQRLLRPYVALRKHLLFVVAALGIGVIAYVVDTAIRTGSSSAKLLNIVMVQSVTLVVLLWIAIILAYELYIRRRTRSNALLDRQKTAYIIKQMQHVLESRTGVSAFFSQKVLNGHTEINLQEAVSNYVNDLLYRTKLIFDEVTGDDCSVCIKLFSISNDGSFPETPVLLQTVRDPSSSAERMIGSNEAVPISENTAFNFIAGQEVHKSFYYNNALYRSYLAGEYRNSRPDWFKFYNATAVCAIKNPSKRFHNDTIGFLCVDNFKGRFDADLTCAIMKSLATCLFYVYRNLALIELGSDRLNREGRVVESEA